ncbi:MAG: DUF4837 family protein [Gemmatimonadota bacterium]
MKTMFLTLRRYGLWIVPALTLLAACGKPQAWGEQSSLIVLAPDSLWERVADSTYAVLEPTIFTTREEKKFQVTQADPGSPQFRDLRVFHRVLVFGTPDDPLIRKAARAAGRIGSLEVPSVFQANDVWASGQVVTAVVLEPGNEVESWFRQLRAVLAMVESSFRDWVRNKMFITGPDTALARQLEEKFGFTITVPRVYDRVVRGDSVVILRNDNPDPSQLIRSLLITWSAPLDSLSPEEAYAWRESIDGVQYNVPQGIDTIRGAVTHFLVGGREALEVTGIWHDEKGDFPAAGPFITWLVQCPGRTLYLDAWLYAPDKPKYEYMLQLQQILGSFSCETSAGA